MMIIHYQLGRSIIEERIARADRARIAAEYRHRRKEHSNAGMPVMTPDAEVIELEFGSHCGAEQIGA